MHSQHVEIECTGCGHVFKAFLEEMAAKNEKIVCPKCGAGCGPDKLSVRPATTAS